MSPGSTHEVHGFLHRFPCHQLEVSAFPTPAWLFRTIELPRPTHKDYLTHLETVNRKEARAMWRDGIKACWDDRCAFCNATPIDDESLTLDHVKPRSRGGQDLTRNLVPACRQCNSDKASQDWKSWYRKQEFYCPVREREIEAWMSQGTRRVDDWAEIGHGDLEWCVNEIERRQEAA